MSPHSDTLFWFWANQSLLFLLNAAYVFNYPVVILDVLCLVWHLCFCCPLKQVHMFGMYNCGSQFSCLQCTLVCVKFPLLQILLLLHGNEHRSPPPTKCHLSYARFPMYRYSEIIQKCQMLLDCPPEDRYWKTTFSLQKGGLIRGRL